MVMRYLENIIDIVDGYKHLGFIFNTRLKDGVGTNGTTLQSTSTYEKDKLFATLKEKVYVTHMGCCTSRVQSETEG